MKKTILMLALLQTGAVTMGTEKAATLSDDFSNPEKASLNWQLSKNNATIKNGKLELNNGGTASLKQVTPDNFTLSFDIALTKPEAGQKTPGFSGVDINGIKFLIRTDGLYWGIYRLPGEKKSRGKAGKIAGFAYDKADTMTITSKKVEKGYKYTCKVNDKQIIDFTFPDTKKRKIILMSWKTGSSIDNVNLKPGI